MKTHRTHKLIRGLATLVGGFALFRESLHAAPFLYSPGDLVLAFRQVGNASDYVVNIGKAANFSALPPDSSLVINTLSIDQLNSAFPSLNGLAWSVAAANRPPLVGDFPLQTIWVTAPRLDPEVQSAPWLRKGQFVQGTAASQIDAVGNAAAAASSSQAAGPNNTATGVVIPSTSDFALAPVLGEAGNYAGTFQGAVENVTADDFSDGSTNVSRSDLYESAPGTSATGTLNTPGRLLGFFELKPDGSLIFSNHLSATPRPTISSITRSGNVTTVAFGTIAGVTYRLRYTNQDGLTSPLSEWSAGTSVSGTGSVLSLEDSQTDPIRFYLVEAQP